MPKLNDESYRCRVCGLLQDEPPWGPDGRTATFDICACCGVEFGYEDATLEGIKRHRREWLEAGARWSEPKARPADWDLDGQLRKIPAEYRDASTPE